MNLLMLLHNSVASEEVGQNLAVMRRKICTAYLCSHHCVLLPQSMGQRYAEQCFIKITISHEITV